VSQRIKGGLERMHSAREGLGQHPALVADGNLQTEPPQQGRRDIEQRDLARHAAAGQLASERAERREPGEESNPGSIKPCVFGATPVASDASAATVRLGRTVLARSAVVYDRDRASSDGMSVG